MLKRAEEIAVEAHRDQTDKTGRPFSAHVRRVAAQVDGRDQKMVAYLHDIVEKANGWSLDRLKAEGFPPAVVGAVDAMTKREDEAYADFVRRAIADPLARPVKRADLEDNLRQAEHFGTDGSKYRMGLEILARHDAAA